MKRLLFIFLSAASLYARGRSWSFEIASGPAYRQDRISWENSSTKEIYPHLRMFDWSLSFEMNQGPFHLGGEGDMGWFSGQEMQKSGLNQFPSPVSFEYTANGRAVTGTVYGGYRFGHVTKAYLMPLAGWVYNSVHLYGARPIPPFFRIEDNLSSPHLFADASIELTSHFTQSWQGPIAGAKLGWQPVQALRLIGFYAYGWLHLQSSFSQSNTLYTYNAGPTLVSVNESVLKDAISVSGGHGNIGAFQLMLFLSPKISLSGVFRYFSFHHQSASVHSATALAELGYRF